MKTKHFFLALMVVLIAFAPIGEVYAQGREEISKDTANALIKDRIFYSRDIRLCWNEAGGKVCNNVGIHDGGVVYVTEYGVLHKGAKYYLVRWNKIRNISTKPGKADVIRLRTKKSAEGLILTDPRSTGSTSTLDTAMDTLLRVLKKNYRKYRNLSARPLPAPIPAPPPPPTPANTQPAVKPVKPVKPVTPPAPPAPPTKIKTTKEISVGMTMKEIEKELGPPLKKIDLETKIIYQYPDLILTFVKGKLKEVRVK